MSNGDMRQRERRSTTLRKIHWRNFNGMIFNVILKTILILRLRYYFYWNNCYIKKCLEDVNTMATERGVKKNTDLFLKHLHDCVVIHQNITAMSRTRNGLERKQTSLCYNRSEKQKKCQLTQKKKSAMASVKSLTAKNTTAAVFTSACQSDRLLSHVYLCKSECSQKRDSI